MPNKILLDSYLEMHTKQIVPETLLVYYKGHKYSVGSDYISKVADIYQVSNELYIDYNSKLIAKHTISHNIVNYNREHYISGISQNMKLDKCDDIEKMANDNLER